MPNIGNIKLYAIGKCPEKYELKQESESKSNQIILGPIMTIIKRNCKLIQLINNDFAIRYTKHDDSVETILII